MEALNKVLPLMFAAIVSMNLSGCGDSTGANSGQPSETGSEMVGIEQKSTGTVDTVSESDTIQSDDYDPTTDKRLKEPSWDDFSKITICGQEFDMPLNVDDFTGEFQIKEGKEGEYAILYQDSIIVIFEYLTDSDEISKAEYTYLYSISGSDFASNEVFSINNYKSSLGLSELLQTLGRPTKIDRDDKGCIRSVYYVFEGYKIRFDYAYNNNEPYLLMVECFVK